MNKLSELAYLAELPTQAETALAELLQARSSEFSYLARVAGLNPKFSFIGADLRDVNFGASDLKGFCFFGADLRGAKLDGAYGLRPNLMTGARLRDDQPRYLELKGDRLPLTSACFSADGMRIAGGSRGGDICVWDIETGEIKLKISSKSYTVGGNLICITFSPDGVYIATSYEDGTIVIWNSKSGDKMAYHAQMSSRRGNISFSADGSRIVTGSLTGTSWIRDPITRKGVLKLEQHEGPVSYAAYSSDGSRVVTGSEDSTCRLWDAENGKEMLRLNGHKSVVICCDFSINVKKIVTASVDRTVRIWDADSGREMFRAEETSNTYFRSVRFSPSGEYIVSAVGNEAWILSTTSGKVLSRLHGHDGFVNSAAYSPDGSRIVTASSDHTVRIWFLDEYAD